MVKSNNIRTPRPIAKTTKPKSKPKSKPKQPLVREETNNNSHRYLQALHQDLKREIQLQNKTKENEIRSLISQFWLNLAELGIPKNNFYDVIWLCFQKALQIVKTKPEQSFDRGLVCLRILMASLPNDYYQSFMRQAKYDLRDTGLFSVLSQVESRYNDAGASELLQQLQDTQEYGGYLC